MTGDDHETKRSAAPTLAGYFRAHPAVIAALIELAVQKCRPSRGRGWDSRVDRGRRPGDERLRAPGPAIRGPRNAPCFCGSGRKFKKCHLGVDPMSLASPQPPPEAGGDGR